MGRYILPAKGLYLHETTIAGGGSEIQLTDALDELLKFDGLNVIETDAGISIVAINRAFLGANLNLGEGMRDPNTRQ